MSDTAVEMFRHKTWATALLIDACGKLESPVLSMTVPGTYGTVHETLQHLVAADEGYLALVSGARREAEPPGLLPTAELAARTRRAGDRWEELVRADRVGATLVRTRDGYELPAAVVMAQAAHHADDHRSHVLTILGARGVEPPGIEIGEDLDVWHYALSTGSMTQVKP